MSNSSLTTRETLSELAERMVQHYVRDLISADELVERLKRAWGENMSEDTCGGSAVESLAWGLCSQTLYEGCQQAGSRVRDLAFKRLSEYLERALSNVGRTIHHSAQEIREEVLQETLGEIFQSMHCKRGKLERPMAFLSWARVILRRQLAHYRQRDQRIELFSLEDEDESPFAEIPDEHMLDPLLVILQCEQRTELDAAIASLHNPNYRAVLRHLYFDEMEIREVANLLEASATDIYLWHHRALHALQKQAIALVRFV